MSIRAHLDSTTYGGSTTIVARLTNEAGAQVGADIALTESGTVSGLFTGTVTGGTASGDYDVRIVDTSDSTLLGVAALFWDGTAEVTTRVVDTVADAILADTSAVEPLVSTNLDATVSSRSTAASIAALNDPTAAQVASQVRTELTAELATLDVAVSSRSTLSAAQVYTEFTAGANEDVFKADVSALATSADISSLNDPTAAATASAVRSELAAELSNLDAAVSSRSTLTAAQVNAEVDTALVDYDPPTQAELAAVQATLIAVIPQLAAIADSVWDEAIAGHITSGTFGRVLQDALAQARLAAALSA